MGTALIAETVTPFIVNATTMQPLLDSINSTLTNTVPAGIGIMGTFMALSVLKRVIFTFL